MRAVLASSLVLALTSAAWADPPKPKIKPEVIELQEPPPPVVRPKVHRYYRKLPPYSDRAILSDTWTRAWMLLEIDEHGTVTRLKTLRRPGADLDDIAVREAFKLQFDPALDQFGKPMRVWIVWGFEWPAHSWVVNLTGLADAMPEDVGFPPRPAWLYIPCRGDGPMRLDSLVYKGYRDCTKPDTSHLAELPWIQRPAKL
ncbi:MAG TPA: hypothetical protein VHE35_03015 [Kofleriaceae bacterium]|nr:hypothetical protein [Kofleriaceae bacterium]